MAELWLAILLALAVTAAFAVVVGRRLPFALWSPVYGIPAVYLSLGLAGFLFYRFSSNYAAGFYDIGVPLFRLSGALAAFIVAAAACIAGSLIYLMLSHRFKRVIRRPATSGAIDPKGRRQKPGRPKPSSLLLLSLPFFLIVVGKGPGSILSRSQYLVESHHYVLVVGDLLSMPAVLGLGFIAAATNRLRWRMLGLGFFAVYWLLFLSLSTRITAVIFMFFVLGLALGGARHRTLLSSLVLWVVALPFLLEVPLALRGMAQQGLVPLPANLARMAAASTAVPYSKV